MNELRQIADGLCQLAALNEPAVLGTVVFVQGSAYRRPGARMLITPAGVRIGCVSGGCLERDVRLRGARLPVDAQVITYDSRGDDQEQWDLGLGCGGRIDVLVERLSAPRAHQLGLFLQAGLTDDNAAILATLVSAPPELELQPGMRVLARRDGHIIQTAEAQTMLRRVPLLALWIADVQTSTGLTLNLPSGNVEVLLEVIAPPPALWVCGAGWDAVPVVAAAKSIGWHVRVIDPRGSHATREHFAAADHVSIGRSSQTVAAHATAPPTAAVIMTHDYVSDLEFLTDLLASDVAYIGVLGPRRRTDRLLADIRGRGVIIPRSRLAALHAPVGLDLGAETPHEIALSIISEIVAWRTGHSGGSLRQRTGSIHHHVPGQVAVVAAQGAVV